MRGIQSYMGWSHIPDMDIIAASSDNNPFAGLKLQGKFQFGCPLMTGCARNLVISPWSKGVLLASLRPVVI